MSKKTHNALAIGMLFSICSLLGSFIPFIPILSILPGVAVGEIAQSIISDESNEKIGILSIWILAILLLSVLGLMLANIKRAIVKRGFVSKRRIAGFMALLYFIVHALGFYIHWGVARSFIGDGQLLFEAHKSFLYSSGFFVIAGLIFDSETNKNLIRNK